MCDVSLLKMVVLPYGVWQKRQCLAVEPIRAAGVLKHLYRMASNIKNLKKWIKISTEWLLSKSFNILLFSCYSSSYVKDSPQWVWHTLLTLVTPKSVRWVHTVRHPPLTIYNVYFMYTVYSVTHWTVQPPSLTQLYNLHPLETPETTGLIGKSLNKMLLLSYFCTNRLSCQFLMNL